MRRWYAVHSKPRQERVAHANLLRQDYWAYLPQCAERPVELPQRALAVTAA